MASDETKLSTSCAHATKLTDSNTWPHANVHAYTHNSTVYTHAWNARRKVQMRTVTRNRRAGEQLAPKSLGGSGETSCHTALRKGDDTSNKSDLNLVRPETWSVAPGSELHSQYVNF